MIRLCLALILACLSLTSPALARGPEETVRVKPVQIAIREGPGTQFPAVATVYKDEELPVLERRGNWILVSARQNGRTEGWLNAAFAEEIDRRELRPDGNWRDRWSGSGDGGWRPDGEGWHRDGTGAWRKKDTGGNWQGGSSQPPDRPGGMRRPEVEAEARGLTCSDRGQMARCEAELRIDVALPGREADLRGGEVRVACRATLDYAGEGDSRPIRTQSDFTANIPVSRGQALDSVAVSFDLPFLRGALESAEVTGIDCRLW